MTSNVWRGTARIRQSDIDETHRPYFGRFVLRAGVFIRLTLGLARASLIVYGFVLSLHR